MPNVNDLSDTIIPKSDQLNADQLLGGPLTITVTNVRRVSEDQPVVINYEGDNGRPYKPCKSMRKVLIFGWGPDGTQWIGRSMTLFNKADVKFGGMEVGGIRISHMSHIDGDIKISVTSTKGKKDQQIIKRLVVADPLALARKDLMEEAQGGKTALMQAWGRLPVAIKKALGGCPADIKAVADAVDAAVQPQPETDDGDVF